MRWRFPAILVHWGILAFLVVYPVMTTADESEPVTTEVFRAETGGYAQYRIPGLVVTSKGTLLAYCEARKGITSDWVAIDVLMRRSTDGGRTWSDPQKVANPPAGITKNPVALAQKLAGPDDLTINNPVAIVDRQTGSIHLLYCVEYARCFHVRSDDDGVTFGPPTEITATFERFRSDYPWKVLAAGPGHGIQLANGRFVVPVWLSNGEGGHGHRPSMVSVVHSDDHGKTWERGDVVVNHPNPLNPSETAAVELSDGRVMLNIRNESEPRLRAYSISPDGAKAWSDFGFDKQLPDPICFGSLVRLPRQPGHDKIRILFSNLDNAKNRDRKNLTIRLSEDDGQTWPVSKALVPGESGYSDLAAGDDGTIYCFYEEGRAGKVPFNPRVLLLSRFSEAWLREAKTPVESPAKP